MIYSNTYLWYSLMSLNHFQWCHMICVIWWSLVLHKLAFFGARSKTLVDSASLCRTSDHQITHIIWHHWKWFKDIQEYQVLLYITWFCIVHVYVISCLSHFKSSKLKRYHMISPNIIWFMMILDDTCGDEVSCCCTWFLTVIWCYMLFMSCYFILFHLIYSVLETCRVLNLHFFGARSKTLIDSAW